MKQHGNCNSAIKIANYEVIRLKEIKNSQDYAFRAEFTAYN